MRIIGQENIQNFKEIKLSKLGHLNVGDVFNATIVEVSEGKVIADIQGKLVLLNNLINLDLSPGESIELEVKMKDNGKVYAKPTNIEFSQELNLEALNQTLKSLGVPINDKNLMVLNFLQKNEYAFNKQELKSLLDNIKFIEKVVSHIEENPSVIKDINLNENIKGELIKLITGKNTTPPEGSPLSIKTVDGELLPIKALFLKNLMGSQKITVLPNDLGAMETSDLESLISNESPSLMAPENFNSLPLDEKLPVFLASALKSVDLDSLMFIIKEDFGMTIEDILLTQNFFDEVKGVDQSLERVIQVLDQATQTVKGEAIEIFKALMLLPEVTDENMNALMKEVVEKFSISSESMPEGLLDEIKEEVVFLRKSMDYNETLIDKLYYQQFLLKENDQLRNVEMFLNKNNKQARSKKGYKIFISLNTKTMGRVKSMIQLRKKQLSIDIMAQDGQTKEKIEKDISGLKDRILAIGFKDVIVKVKLDVNGQIKKDMLLKNISSRLDLRV